MQSKFIFYFLFLLFFSCSIFQNKKNSSDTILSNELNSLESSKESPLVTMRKTPCFGKCPYFEVSIFPNGTVIYEGLKFVERIGVYTSTIDIKKIALIEDYIRRVDFFSFHEIYDAGVTDLPSIIIEVNFKGNNHKVKGRYRMPENFKLFSIFIDDIISEIEFWDKVMN